MPPHGKVIRPPRGCNSQVENHSSRRPASACATLDSQFTLLACNRGMFGRASVSRHSLWGMLYHAHQKTLNQCACEPEAEVCRRVVTQGASLSQTQPKNMSSDKNHCPCIYLSYLFLKEKPIMLLKASGPHLQ